MTSDSEAQDHELLQGVFEDPDEPLLDEVPIGEGEAEPEEGDPEASGVTSHVLVCDGAIVTSKSTFRAPTTGFLFMRVGYFDSRGARLWLSPWKNHESMNALTTKIHWEKWDFGSRRVARAVVVSRFPEWSQVDGHKWDSC